MLTPLAVASPVTMLVLAAVTGGAVGVNLPVSLMIMVDAVGESVRGKLMGLRLLARQPRCQSAPTTDLEWLFAWWGP